MSLQASFSHIDRHAAWGARPASIFVLLGLGALVGAGAMWAPNRAEPDAGFNPAAILGTLAVSPCLPHDAALGNEGGDPYGFYVFNREEELATQRSAPSCASTVANTVDDMRQNPHVATHGSLINQASAAPTAP